MKTHNLTVRHEFVRPEYSKFWLRGFWERSVVRALNEFFEPGQRQFSMGQVMVEPMFHPTPPRPAEPPMENYHCELRVRRGTGPDVTGVAYNGPDGELCVEVHVPEFPAIEEPPGEYYLCRHFVVTILHEFCHAIPGPCTWRSAPAREARATPVATKDTAQRGRIAPPAPGRGADEPSPLFQCPRCEGLHFNISTEGTLTCANASKFTGFEIRPGGCGWRGGLGRLEACPTPPSILHPPSSPLVPSPFS